jgi:hypothetical protein
LRQHKIFSETLNRFLMAAPRCARARCAGVNTVSVDRQLRQSEVIEKFPYSLCVSPERFPVAVVACPARQCPTVQHLQNLILKKAEGNLSDSLPRRLPLLLDCQAPVGEASSKVQSVAGFFAQTAAGFPSIVCVAFAAQHRRQRAPHLGAKPHGACRRGRGAGCQTGTALGARSTAQTQRQHQQQKLKQGVGGKRTSAQPKSVLLRGEMADAAPVSARLHRVRRNSAPEVLEPSP